MKKKIKKKFNPESQAYCFELYAVEVFIIITTSMKLCLYAQMDLFTPKLDPI